MVIVDVRPGCVRPAAQALALLHLTLPAKYADVIQFLQSSDSSRVPDMIASVFRLECELV